MPATPETAWIVTDGATGNARQARALADAMGVEVRAITLSLRAPWSWFAPWNFPGAWQMLERGPSASFSPPWPDLVIGCGRDAALATRLLHQRSGGACFCVQILDPRIDTRHWNAVVAPAHDRVRGDNVLPTLGSLNPIDAAWLADGRAVFPHFAELPRPRVALLLGGPRRGIAFDTTFAEELLAMVQAVAGAGSVLATTSRRTPPAFATHLREALATRPGTFADAGGMNPYAGVLGWADAIVVTPDSVNMLSEACATGVPVHTVVAAPLPERIARFHAALRERGLLTDPGAPRADVPPLRETFDIADALLACYAARV